MPNNAILQSFREDEFNSLVRLTVVNGCSDLSKSTRVTISQIFQNSLAESNIRKILWKLTKTNSLLASIEFDDIGVEAPTSHQMKVKTGLRHFWADARFVSRWVQGARVLFMQLSTVVKSCDFHSRSQNPHEMNTSSAFSVQFHRVFREWTFPWLRNLANFRTQLC